MILFPSDDVESSRRAWNHALATSPMTKRVIRTPEDQIKRWDKMARVFAPSRRPQGSDAAEEDIIRRLEAKGALHPGASVLDIGAGLGDLTLRLARIAGRVTALEPSAGMARVLEKRVRDLGIANIRVEKRRWQEVDAEEEGLRSRFDLVVASMNPGVSGPGDLDKMNRVSRGYCYLSRFSGLRGLYGFDGVWEDLFKEDPGMDPWDIHFPFNMLYAWGYRPSLDFIIRDHPGRIETEKAKQMILALLWNYTETTPEVRKAVETMITARAADGFVPYDKAFCQGIMIWQAGENKTDLPAPPASPRR